MENNHFKSGFVSIIGRANVGKSTLLNQILKAHLVIVSPKSQTTRNKIQGIYTTDNEQIIFVDTPGIHKASTELGNVMNEMAYKSLDGTDLILFMCEANKKIGPGDLFVLEQLKKVKIPVILVLNKVDMVKDEEELRLTIDEFKTLYPFSGGITISASENFNVDNLLKMIIERLPYGPKYYPDDQALDLPVRFVVSEIIREKVLLLTQEEVPHSVAVTIDKFSEEEKMIDINATIICERPSQKKIIIGHEGKMIKQIGTLARLDIKKLLDKGIYLELFVKVEENWRNNKKYLKEFGYNIDDYN